MNNKNGTVVSSKGKATVKGVSCKESTIDMMMLHIWTYVGR